MGKGILSRAGQHIRELPPKHRQYLVGVLVFAVLLICTTALTVYDYNRLGDTWREAAIPDAIIKLGTLLASLCNEAREAITFSMDAENETAFTKYLAVQSVVDAEYDRVMSYISSSKQFHVWSEDLPFMRDGTVLSEQGLGAISYVRSQVVLGELSFGAQHIREYYMDIIQGAIGVMATLGHAFSRKFDFPGIMHSNVINSMAYEIVAIEHHGFLYTSAVADKLADEVIEEELKLTFFHMLLYDTIVRCLARPLMDTQKRHVLGLHTATYNVNTLFQSFIVKGTREKLLPDTVAIVERDSFTAIQDLLSELQHHVSSIRNPKDAANRFQVFLSLSLLCGVALIALLGMFVFCRWRDAHRSALELSNAGVMHDVLVRVSEYIKEVATFSLAPKPPPRCMQGSEVAIVEQQLEHLVGSLRAIAPFLPPLLFSQRMRDTAEKRSDVKDPATMTLVEKPRSDLHEESVELQDTSMEAVLLKQMADKTDLQEHICDVALVYVSLTSFHDLRGERRHFSEVYFRKVSAMIEECVYQYDGVLYSMSFDRAVGVWGVEDKQSKFCEQAASCALMLANRLTILRKQEQLVKEHFPVHIGVVGGTVNIGVFGNEERKSLTILGPPTLRGMFVAQVNAFHMTRVACDEYIREAVQKIYICKPMELVPEAGCVYEISREANHDDPELDLQILAYNKAFELFQKKHYRGALKAFRAYTKQYGYDSSVERIQTLIAGA